MMKRSTNKLLVRLPTSEAKELGICVQIVLDLTQYRILIFKYFHSGPQCCSLPEASLEQIHSYENVP